MDKINDASSKFTFLFKKRLRDSEVVSLCGSSTLSFVNVLKSKKEKFILNTNLTSIPPKIGKIFVSTQKTDQSISDNSLSSLQVKKKKKPKAKTPTIKVNTLPPDNLINLAFDKEPKAPSIPVTKADINEENETVNDAESVDLFNEPNKEENEEMINENKSNDSVNIEDNNDAIFDDNLMDDSQNYIDDDNDETAKEQKEEIKETSTKITIPLIDIEESSPKMKNTAEEKKEKKKENIIINNITNNITINNNITQVIKRNKKLIIDDEENDHDKSHIDKKDVTNINNIKPLKKITSNVKVTSKYYPYVTVKGTLIKFPMSVVNYEKKQPNEVKKTEKVNTVKKEHELICLSMISNLLPKIKSKFALRENSLINSDAEFAHITSMITAMQNNPDANQRVRQCVMKTMKILHTIFTLIESSTKPLSFLSDVLCLLDIIYAFHHNTKILYKKENKTSVAFNIMKISFKYISSLIKVKLYDKTYLKEIIGKNDMNILIKFAKIYKSYVSSMQRMLNAFEKNKEKKYEMMSVYLEMNPTVIKFQRCFKIAKKVIEFAFDSVSRNKKNNS